MDHIPPKDQQREKAARGFDEEPVGEAFEAAVLGREIGVIQDILLADEELSTLAEEIDRDELPSNYPFHCFDSVEV